MTKRTYDIFHGETLCGTTWARSIEGGKERTFCIECALRLNEVRHIGLRPSRMKALYTFSKHGKPRRIEITSDLGNTAEINISDRAMDYGKGDIPLNQPLDLALGNNMTPLLAIWWEKFRDRRPDTFRTLIPETGAVIDYTLELVDGTLRSSLGEIIVLDDEDEIFEVRPESSDFVIRRCQRPFPNWKFRRRPKQDAYHTPTDLNIEDVKIEESGKAFEASIVRPLHQSVAAVGVFIGGTGIYGRHGITSTIDIGYHQLLDDLARQGIATVRYDKFDQRASNPVEAEGSIDFPTLCRDAERWLEWLDGQPWADGIPRIVIGHSMGGIVALSLSTDHLEISACVLLSTPGRPLCEVIESQAAWNHEQVPSSIKAKTEALRMRHALLDALALDGEWTADSVDKKLLPLKHKRRFLQSVIHLDPGDFIPRGSCLLIIVRGTADIQVFAEDATLLLDAAQRAGRPVEFIKAEGLDHLLKRTRKTGFEALAAYRDRRRRIPISLIRRISLSLLNLLEKY